MAVVGLELISFFPNEWSPSSGSVSIVSDTGRPVSLLTSVTVTSLSGVALMRYDSAPLADLYWLNRLLILIRQRQRRKHSRGASKTDCRSKASSRRAHSLLRISRLESIRMKP